MYFSQSSPYLVIYGSVTRLFEINRNLLFQAGLVISDLSVNEENGKVYCVEVGNRCVKSCRKAPCHAHDPVTPFKLDSGVNSKVGI